jgi:uncharacterized surface protein with fasciclin (FAS1) repeats
MTRRLTAFLAALGLATGATAAAAAPGDSPTPTHSIAETLDAGLGVGSFNTLHAALRETGLEGLLHNEGPLTIFAPTDEAFAALPAGTVERLMDPAGHDALVALLQRHVVPGMVMAEEVLGRSFEVDTLAGAPLAIDARTIFSVGGAGLLARDIPASNGVVHVIDRVLVPEGMS